ncbi:MAG: hypothetical protein K2N47_04950, partial [Clostridia bacterium]|nr:hypothetical protein [Clostridia bacterium]
GYTGEPINHEFEFEFLEGTSLVGEEEKLKVKVKYYTAPECTESDEVKLGRNVPGPTNPGVYYVKYDEAKSLVGNIFANVNYDVYCPDVVTFTIASREIEITLKDISKVYDGTAFNFVTDRGYVLGVVEGEDGESVGKVLGLGYEFTGLLEGVDAPTIVVSYDGYDAEPRNAGTYKVRIESVEFAQNGVYSFAEDPVGKTCWLTIEKRVINVELGNASGKDIIAEVPNKNAINDSIFPTADVVRSTAENAAGEGIVENDKQYIVFLYNTYTDKPDNYGTYALSMKLDSTGAEDGYDVTQNYAFTADNVKGCNFIICSRHIIVTPMILGSSIITYGDALGVDNFDVWDYHASNASEDGFLSYYDRLTFKIKISKSVEGGIGELVGTITIAYKAAGLILSSSKTFDKLPTDAGVYTLEVEVTNVSAADNYYIECQTAELIIEQKKLTIEINNTPAASYNYGEITNNYFVVTNVDGIKEGDTVAVAIGVYNGTTAVTTKGSLDAGDYTAKAVKSGKDSNNYVVVFEEFNFTVKPLIYAITPDAPEAQLLSSTHTDVTLASDGYKLWSVSSSEAKEVAKNTISGIKVSSETISYPTFSKKVTFNSVTIGSKTADDGNNYIEADKNHIVYFAYDLSIRRAFTASDFTTELAFKQFDVEYELKENVGGKTFNYTGAAMEYDVGSTSVSQTIKSIEPLYSDLKHELWLSGSEVTIGPEIGVYNNWFNELMRVKDENENDVTAFYNFFTTTDPLEIAASKIVIDGLDPSDLDTAEANSQLYDFEVINSESYTIKLNGDPDLGNLNVALITPDDADGGVIRVVIYYFNTRNQMVDASEYYDVAINGYYSSKFKLVSLSELQNSIRTATVKAATEDELSGLTLGGNFTETKGYYILDNSDYYTVKGTVSGVKVGIFGYIGADDKLHLAYSAYATTRSGLISDENASYVIDFDSKLKDTVFKNYDVEYMTLEQITKASNVVTVTVNGTSFDNRDSKNTFLSASSYSVSLKIKGEPVNATQNSANDGYTFVLSNVTYNLKIVWVGGAFKAVIYSEVIRGSSRNPIITRTYYTQTYTIVSAGSETVEEGSLSDIIF